MTLFLFYNQEVYVSTTKHFNYTFTAIEPGENGQLGLDGDMVWTVTCLALSLALNALRTW